MSNYTKTTDFEAKDSLPTGDSGKIIRGAEFETEFDAISTAIATKADTAGPTFTGTLTFETISDGTIGVTAFVDEDDMVSNSATLVPTQQSVKAYVDSQVTAQDLDFQADSGGALSIDLDSESLTFTGGTGIDTSGSLNTVTFAIDSTVATLTGTQTLTNKTLTAPDVNTPDIDGGTIDGTVIGGTTAAAGSFTTVSATGNITVGGTVDGRDVATDGTKLDTVETNADVTDTSNVTAAGALMDSELTNETAVKSLDQGVATTDSPTFAGLTTTANISFGDNDKAIFGAGSDLQIYHSGSASFIDDAGGGDLNLRAYNDLNIKNINNDNIAVRVRLLDGSEFVELHHAGSTKLSTTSTGIDVTGTVEFDGLSGTGSVSVTDILDQDDMSSNSATALATQQSIKAYVDSQVATVDTLAEVLGNGNTTGGTDIAVGTGDDITFADSSKAIFGAGSDLEIFSDGTNGRISLNSAAGNLRMLADEFQLANTGYTNFYLTTTADDAVRLFHGGDQKFETTSTGVDVTGNVVSDGLTVDGNATINSASPLIYLTESDTTDLNTRIRNAAGNFQIHTGNDALNSFTARMNISHSTGDISFYEDTGTTAKLTWDASAETLNFADNGKAVFGAGNDLQIYHDGSHSRLVDSGTGNFIIQAGEFRVNTSDDGEAMIKGNENGDVELYFNGAQKLATTSTGIDVTGTVTADGLTVSSASANVADLRRENNTGAGQVLLGNSDGYVRLSGANGSFDVFNAGNTAQRFGIANNGDISFYEDTGTTAKLFWDASAESLGIGTTSPTSVSNYSSLSVDGTNGSLIDSYYGGTLGGRIQAYSSKYLISAQGASLPLALGTNNTERMRIDSSGNVGIGTSSPLRGLDVRTAASGFGNTFLVDTTSGTTGTGGGVIFGSDDGQGTDVSVAAIQGIKENSTAGNQQGALLFTTKNSIAQNLERMRIDSSGNVTVNNGNISAENGEVHAKDGSGGYYARMAAQYAYPYMNALFDAVASTSYNGQILFRTNSNGGAMQERMRIDSSGSLLHGTTSSSIYNATSGDGVNIKGQQGQIIIAKNATSSADPALWLNNTGVDGSIATFAKDGSTVGSIGTNGGDLTVNAQTVGVLQVGGAGQFAWTSNLFYPTADDARDLGTASLRFDDIYATNGTIQTSDRNEKQDIEALSDAEQRVAVACKGLLRKFRWKSLVEEKGDEARIHFGIIAQDLQAAFEAEGLDAGRYAMFINSTWTDEETGEERTRMGVRYSELLAFIIAAI